jgi:hypothetical protein
MIVANRKSLDEILRMIKPYKKILLLGEKVNMQMCQEECFEFFEKCYPLESRWLR